MFFKNEMSNFDVEYKLFTTIIPSEPIAMPDGAYAVIVFDPTIQGYRAAIKWINENKSNGKLYRQIIPYAESCNDVGDYLLSNNNKKILGNASMFSPDHQFEVMCIDTETIIEEKTWPFYSQNRVVDFICALKHLESRLLLRDAITGLNILQVYMLECGLKDSDDIKALCVSHFKMPLAVVGEAYDTMYRGNHPPNTPFPFVFVNGPKPLNPYDVFNGIVELLNNDIEINWEDLQPYCPPYVFKDGFSLSVKSDDEIIQPAYGVSAIKTSTWFSKQITYDCSIIKIPIKWNPLFVQGELTEKEYFDIWLDFHLQKLRKEKMNLLYELDAIERKREFARCLSVSKKIDNEMTMRIFIDENMDEKRIRIETDFDDDQSLMKMPVECLDKDFCSEGLDDTILQPEISIPGMLVKKLNDYLKNLLK
jgi:hypothetical protein